MDSELLCDEDNPGWEGVALGCEVFLELWNPLGVIADLELKVEELGEFFFVLGNFHPFEESVTVFFIGNV